MFYETKTRTAVKAVVWRIIATLITWGTAYYYTRKLSESIELTIVAALIGIAAYYVYERVWNRIQWGKRTVG
jgi:uncharacterized membrane protein